MSRFLNIDGKIHRTFWTITWADKATGDLVGEEELDSFIGEEEVALATINIVEEFDDFSVRPRHAAILQGHVEHEIDLDRYDYFYGQKTDPAPLATWGEAAPASS